jgi:hypothetical protein
MGADTFAAKRCFEQPRQNGFERNLADANARNRILRGRHLHADSVTSTPNRERATVRLHEQPVIRFAVVFGFVLDPRRSAHLCEHLGISFCNPELRSKNPDVTWLEKQSRAPFIHDFRHRAEPRRDYRGPGGKGLDDH